MQSISFYFKHPKTVGNIILYYLCRWWMPDKLYLKLKFRLWMGHSLNLKQPKSFAEKLQWLKLYDRKPFYHNMVDKVESKIFISNIIGEGYTIPTLGVYNSFEDISWDTLPQQFILKATHDSGSFFVVKDKNNLDKVKCKKQIYVHWNKDYYKGSREWQYKGIKSRIIAEPLIADPASLKEFKFFCFEGEPKFYQTCTDRDRSRGGAALAFYDINNQPIDIQDAWHTRCSLTKFNPTRIELMLDLARKLSKDMHFLRIDFFEVNGKVYVGELTLHENAGFCYFKPDRWNDTLGSWIILPTDK